MLIRLFRFAEFELTRRVLRHTTSWISRGFRATICLRSLKCKVLPLPAKLVMILHHAGVNEV